MACLLGLPIGQEYFGYRDLSLGIGNGTDIHGPLFSGGFYNGSLGARQRDLHVRTESRLQVAFTDAQVLQQIGIACRQRIDIALEARGVLAMHQIMNKRPCLDIKDVSFRRFVVIRRSRINGEESFKRNE